MRCASATVSGERYIDHQAEVRGWFIKD